METNLSAVTVSGLKHRLEGAPARAGRFLWHFVQMVLAMEAGMMVYHKLVAPLLAGTAYGALTGAYPLFGYWMMIVSMVLPMIALMRYHRSTWRYSLEMTLAMIAPLAALTALALCDVLPAHTLYGLGDPLMFVAMAAFMLVRPHEHAHGAHQHAADRRPGLTEAGACHDSAH